MQERSAGSFQLLPFRDGVMGREWPHIKAHTLPGVAASAWVMWGHEGHVIGAQRGTSVQVIVAKKLPVGSAEAVVRAASQSHVSLCPPPLRKLTPRACLSKSLQLAAASQSLFPGDSDQWQYSQQLPEVGTMVS